MKHVIALLMAMMMLTGAALAECPKIDAKDYPRVDGSTATLPLSYRLMEAATGVDEAAAMDAIRHNKTTESFYALMDGRADLLVSIPSVRRVLGIMEAVWKSAERNEVVVPESET